MVECRDAHARNTRQFLHVEWLGVVGPKPRDRSRCSVAQVAPRRDRMEALPLWTSENAVGDFAVDQGTEEWYVLRSIQKIEQPAGGVQQAGRRFTDCQSPWLRRSFRFG